MHRCADCRHFVDDPDAFEKALPGILILSSGQGDTKGDQGICSRHDRMCTSKMTCPQFEARRSRSR